MTSWRDSASQQAQDDLDGLLNMTLPFAQQMLAKGGEFYPSVRCHRDYQRGDVAASWRSGPGASGQCRCSLPLVDGLRQDRAVFRAAAICSDVQLPESDAVRVELEHQDGHAMAVLMPYKKKRFGRADEYDDLRGGTADNQIWM